MNWKQYSVSTVAEVSRGQYKNTWGNIQQSGDTAEWWQVAGTRSKWGETWTKWLSKETGKNNADKESPCVRTGKLRTHRGLERIWVALYGWSKGRWSWRSGGQTMADVRACWRNRKSLKDVDRRETSILEKLLWHVNGERYKSNKNEDRVMFKRFRWRTMEDKVRTWGRENYRGVQVSLLPYLSGRASECLCNLM